MAHYLVRAKVRNLNELRARIDSGDIQRMRPFGDELHQCLLDARMDDGGWVTWEETCYCSPPLKQEREVLDVYFTELTTQTIKQGEGWMQISHLPALWS